MMLSNPSGLYVEKLLRALVDSSKSQVSAATPSWHALLLKAEQYLDASHDKNRRIRASAMWQPDAKHLEPKTSYCWWWSYEIEAWEYCDARACSTDDYPFWLPYDELLHPGS